MASLGDNPIAQNLETFRDSGGLVESFDLMAELTDIRLLEWTRFEDVLGSLLVAEKLDLGKLQVLVECLHGDGYILAVLLARRVERSMCL